VVPFLKNWIACWQVSIQSLNCFQATSYCLASFSRMAFADFRSFCHFSCVAPISSMVSARSWMELLDKSMFALSSCILDSPAESWDLTAESRAVHHSLKVENLACSLDISFCACATMSSISWTAVATGLACAPVLAWLAPPRKVSNAKAKHATFPGSESRMGTAKLR